MENGQLHLKVIKISCFLSGSGVNHICSLLCGEMGNSVKTFLTCDLMYFYFTARLGRMLKSFSSGSIFDHNTLLR